MIRKILIIYAVLTSLAGPVFGQGTWMTTSRKTGIGTMPQGQLHVVSTSTVDSFVFATSHTITGFGLVVSTGGNVGVGTSSPGARLEVAGQVKITGGSPGAGRVLTSDGAGLAVWQSIAGTGIGDNLGNHIATAALQMQTFPITGTGALTMSSATLTNTAGAGLMVSSSAYLAVSGGNVGIGTTGPNARLQIDGMGSLDATALRIEGADTYKRDILFSEFGTTAYGGLIRYDSGNDILQLLTLENSVEKQGISIARASGNVGIGTTAPGSKLEVNGNARILGDKPLRLGEGSNTYYYDMGREASSGGFVIDGNQTGSVNYAFRKGGSDMLTIANNGNVGIGTTGPVAKLQVGTNTTSINADVSTLMQIGASSPGGEVVGLSIVNSATGATGNTTAINFHNGGNYSSIGGIALISEATFPNSSLALRYFNAGVKEGLRINSGGNVGIGTAGPAYKLHSAGTLGTGSTGTEGYLGFKRASDGAELASIKTDSTNNLFIINSGAGALTFQASGTEVARITGGGYVGIGTTAPAEKLEVNGGYIKASSWPAFSVYNNDGGDQTTATIWPGKVIYFNNGGHYSTSTYKFTAPVAGWYHFSWVCYTNVKTGRAGIWKNNSIIVQTEDNGKSIDVTMELAAGDTAWLGPPSGSFPMTWYGAGGHNVFSGHLIMAK